MTRIKLFPLGVALALLAVSAQAGPPLICHPFDIGTAKSLPWGDGQGWDRARSDYDLKRLVAGTLALLTPDTPVVVRMETLRRATVYAAKDRAIARELLGRLMERASEAESKGKSDALALFDAGYLAESYKQMSRELKGLTPANDVNGYALVRRAIGLRGKDPEMEFAAALITWSDKSAQHHEHYRNTVNGAAEGSLLARNLVSHFSHKGQTLAELREK